MPIAEKDEPNGLDWSKETSPPLPGQQGEENYDHDLHVPCPSHTTERKLVNKIDWHVLPYLCILYLLAFLDRYANRIEFDQIFS